MIMNGYRAMRTLKKYLAGKKKELGLMVGKGVHVFFWIFCFYFLDFFLCLGRPSPTVSLPELIRSLTCVLSCFPKCCHTRIHSMALFIKSHTWILIFFTKPKSLTARINQIPYLRLKWSHSLPGHRKRFP